MTKKETNEEVVDAKEESTAVAKTETTTAVSAPITVQGVSLRFPFIRIGQALSQWRVGGKPPMQGCFYIGKDKQTNTLLAESGRENGLTGILLDVVPGICEDKPFTGNANPPKRWVGPDAEANAAKEGFTLTPRDTGKTWPDTGRPIMRSNAGKFCYLQMLVPVPDDFESFEYQLFPIGDHLYTPARIEYSKMAFKELDSIIGNIERMEEFKHRKEEGFKFTWLGKICHLYTREAISKQTGSSYPFLCFELSVKDGAAVELGKAEKEDFVKFLASVKETTVDSTDTSSEDDW